MEAHSRALFPLVVDLEDERELRGRVEAHDLGAMSLLRFRGRRSTVRRTPRTIAAGDPEHVQFALALAGSCEVQQGDLVARLGPGDLSTWDSSRPFRVPHAGAFDLLILSVPVQLLAAPRRAATAQLLPGRWGAGAVAGSMLRESWRQLEDAAIGADHPDLHDALLAIARMLVSRPYMPAELPSWPRLVDGARAYAERHLGDMALDPAALARSQHVSLRRLQLAFAQEGDTVAGWLRRARLARIHSDLADPDLADVPIGAIAARWGLLNHAHMTRAFRALYGCTPSDVRAASAGSRSSCGRRRSR